MDFEVLLPGDEQRIVDESLTSIARAGAEIIITYYATEVSRRLRG